MNVITIESSAFSQIMKRFQRLDDKFVELEQKASIPLSERWFDNQELALLLKTSKRTLQAYRDELKIGYSQVGNKIYYKASDVEAFLKKNYHKTPKY